jgi:hypothetical protein
MPPIDLKTARGAMWSARRAILLLSAARYDNYQRNKRRCFMHQTGFDREKKTG